MIQGIQANEDLAVKDIVLHFKDDSDAHLDEGFAGEVKTQPDGTKKLHFFIGKEVSNDKLVEILSALQQFIDAVFSQPEGEEQ